MRSHLITCLQQGRMENFPQINEGVSHQVISIRSCPSNSVVNALCQRTFLKQWWNVIHNTTGFTRSVWILIQPHQLKMLCGIAVHASKFMQFMYTSSFLGDYLSSSKELFLILVFLKCYVFCEHVSHAKPAASCEMMCMEARKCTMVMAR